MAALSSLEKNRSVQADPFLPVKAEFARRIGIPKTHIERLFSLRHHSRLDRIEAAFAALGKRLHVEVRNAA